MDKKKKVRKESEAQNFMEKLLTRLKMTKHSLADKTEGRGKVTSVSSNEQKPSFFSDQPKISAENLMEFSEQLQHFLNYVQQLKEVSFYTYDYPRSLSSKLEREAVELRNLFRDVRAAAIDIERLKKQRQAVKKEKMLVAKKLNKLRDEEMKELESVIHAYAKPLFSKWETIKNTQKTEILESFMNEVAGKHKAMEILQELITRKLSKLGKNPAPMTFNFMKNVSSTTITKIKNSTEHNSSTMANWNIMPLSEAGKSALGTERSARSNDRDILRINRRKRQRDIREERRRPNDDNANQGLDLQLVPINRLSNDDLEEMVTVRTTPLISARSPVDYVSDEDTVSLTSSDFVIDNLVPHSGTHDVQSDLQIEMRNVLQALFGEIRQIPQLGLNNRNRHNSGNNLRSPRTASH